MDENVLTVSSGWMKPKPLVLLNHFTVPVAISVYSSVAMRTRRAVKPILFIFRRVKPSKNENYKPTSGLRREKPLLCLGTHRTGAGELERNALQDARVPRNLSDKDTSEPPSMPARQPPEWIEADLQNGWRERWLVSNPSCLTSADAWTDVSAGKRTASIGPACGQLQSAARSQAWFEEEALPGAMRGDAGPTPCRLP